MGKSNVVAGTKVPALRFKGYNDEWVDKKLGDIAENYYAGGDINRELIKESGKYPVLANGLTNAGVQGYYDEQYRVEAPAITITGRGDVGHVKARYENFTPVVRLIAMTSKHDVHFLENAMSQINFFNESTGVPQLTVPQLKTYSLNMIDDLEEQQQIGEVFKTADALIQSEQQKLEQLQSLKKSFLQKMFPKKGTTVPELRFDGFSADWMEKKLGDVLTSYPSRKHISDINCDDDVMYLEIQQGDSPKAGHSKGIPFEEFSEVILFGDHTLSLYSPDEPFVLSTDGLKILGSNSLDIDFLYEIININKPVSEGYKRHFSILRNRRVKYPISPKEQVAIGQFFKTFDKLISKQNEKVENVKTLKKSLLQKMLV